MKTANEQSDYEAGSDLSGDLSVWILDYDADDVARIVADETYLVGVLGVNTSLYGFFSSVKGRMLYQNAEEDGSRDVDTLTASLERGGTYQLALGNTFTQPRYTFSGGDGVTVGNTVVATNAAAEATSVSRYVAVYTAEGEFVDLIMAAQDVSTNSLSYSAEFLARETGDYIFFVSQETSDGASLVEVIGSKTYLSSTTIAIAQTGEVDPWNLTLTETDRGVQVQLQTGSPLKDGQSGEIVVSFTLSYENMYKLQVTDSLALAGDGRSYDIATQENGDITVIVTIESSFFLSTGEDLLTLDFLGGVVAGEVSVKDVTITVDNQPALIDYDASLETAAGKTPPSVFEMQTDVYFLGMPAAIESNGSQYDDTMTGSIYVDVLRGLGGDDIISADQYGFDTIYGGAGDDTLGNGAGDDAIFGDAGEDILIGAGGQDTLTGGLGEDSISGDAGNDSMQGNQGDDFMTGGAGADSLDGGNGDDIVYGDKGADLILGGQGGDLLDGWYGNDTVYGGNGADSICADFGNDSLFGGAGADTLQAGQGYDSLYGGQGEDMMNGARGDDLMYGGQGADWLLGGQGADTFKLGSVRESTTWASGRDTILDFDAAGQDKLDLGALDANWTLSGNQGFRFIGSRNFTGEAGELRAYRAGGDTYVTGDNNGDGRADFAIVLSGKITLEATDFLL